MNRWIKFILKIIGSVIVILACGGIITGIIDFIKNRSNKQHKMNGPYEKIFKRPIDFMCGMTAIIVFWPLYIIVAILVRLKLGSPVLFTQERPGKDEKIFKLYKFRTMTDEKDENGNLLPDDVRLTKFGKLLRATSLDELPEAFNIIKGDMSVIGPRPLLTSYLPYYTEEERHRHDVRPGLSGLAQVEGRNYMSWQERFEKDLYYVNNISFKQDISIIIQSALVALMRKNVSDRSAIQKEENGVLFIIRDGKKYPYPKPLNIERGSIES